MMKFTALTSLALSLLPTLAVQAQTRLDHQVIRFSEDTIVEFEMATTQGANRSEFGVIANPDSVATKVPLFVERQAYDDFGLVGLTDYQGTVNGGTIEGVEGNGTKIVTVRNNAAQGQGSVIVEYLFEANTPYVFYVDIYTATENRYITTLTSVNVQNTQFSGDLNDGQGLAIAWEDKGEGRITGSGLEVEFSDEDFNDVVVFAGGQLPCFKRI